MRTFSKLVVLLGLWIATAAPSCQLTQYGGPPPNPGSYSIFAPYYFQQTDWYCIPATILMWHDKVIGQNPSVTQDSIWNWMASNYPGQTSAGPGGGVTPAAAAAAANTFTGRPIGGITQYNFSQLQQAVADEAWGLQNDNPTIVIINNGRLAVLFTGTSWAKLQDALQRPNIDYVTVHDPWTGYNPATGQQGGANVVITVGYWMNFVIPNPNCGSCVQSIQASGQYFHPQSLQGFNLDGGRYYGPTPASPAGRYMLDGNGACYWEPNDDGEGQCTPVYTGRSDQLGPNQYLYPGDSRTSVDGRFTLNYQGDGNLVLYNQGTPLWASNTAGTSPGFAVMAGDGNLIVYDGGGTPVWTSNTSGYDNAWLSVQNDGELLIYTSDGSSVPWRSGTCCY